MAQLRLAAVLDVFSFVCFFFGLLFFLILLSFGNVLLRKHVSRFDERTCRLRCAQVHRRRYGRDGQECCQTTPRTSSPITRVEERAAPIMPTTKPRFDLRKEIFPGKRDSGTKCWKIRQRACVKMGVGGPGAFGLMAGQRVTGVPGCHH